MSNQSLAQHVADTNSDAADLGRKAAAKWNSGERDLGQGDAMATAALFKAWHTMNLQAKITDKRTGATLETLDFDLHDYHTKQCNKPDGSRDNKLTLARTEAVAYAVFGIEANKLTNAHKQRIGRAMVRVAYLCSQGFDETHVKLSSRGFLQVPYTVMHDEPGEDADERERRDYNNNKGDFETLDGKDGQSLAALDRRAKPAGNRVTTRADVSKAVEFAASVNLLNRVLKSMNDASGETSGSEQVPAFNKEVRAHLFELQSQLAAYFDADPMEEAKEARKAS